MKKEAEEYSKKKVIILTVAIVLGVILVIIPLITTLFSHNSFGNVALIPLEGTITSQGGSTFGETTISASEIVDYIKEADKNPLVKVILLEINSPGGSAVASDEIATAVKETKKPVVALIKEVGASGGYWIASASDHIIANRMSITGSIGVISSYLEFSGLMDKYGVSYERLIAGEHKDLGTPLKKLYPEEKQILQKKLNTIHQFFIKGVAENRNLPKEEVEKLATGEFYLGVEALELDLIDQLGNKDTAESYLKEKYNLEKIEYITYKHPAGFFETLSGVFSEFFFKAGQGFGSMIVKQSNIITV
jgi:protease-4